MMNNTAINMGVPLGIFPAVVSLDHMVVLVLVFSGTSMLLSIAVALICIPTSSTEVFPFPKTSPAFVVACVIDHSFIILF
jgi:hypothetical protein